MSKKGLAPVPDQEPDEVRRVELHGKYEGKWVEYKKEPTGRQTIAFLRADEDRAGALEAFAQRVVDHNFGGDILDQDYSVLALVIQSWTKADEDLALDPSTARP